MRTTSGAFDSAIAQNALRGVLLLQLDLDSGTLRFNSSAVTLTWGGFDWISAGAWGGVSSTKEALSGEISGISVELNGLPTNLVSLVLSEHTQGRKAYMYFALLDSNYDFIIDPCIEFVGLCDAPIILDQRDGTSKIQLPIESRIIDFKRPATTRWNSTDHKIEHPNDTFFDYVESMVDKSIVWPNREFFKK